MTAVLKVSLNVNDELTRADRTYCRPQSDVLIHDVPHAEVEMARDRPIPQAAETGALEDTITSQDVEPVPDPEGGWTPTGRS